MTLFNFFVRVEEQLKRETYFRKSSSSNYPTKEYKKDNYFEQDHKKKIGIGHQIKKKIKIIMSLLLKKSKLSKSNVSSVLKKRHCASECPKKQNMVLKEQDTIIIETSSSSDNEKELVSSEEEIQPCTSELLVVQRILQSCPVELDQS